MYIGVDFGTTNSGAAVLDGQQVRVFPIDPASPDPTVMRSILYITREHRTIVGREAVDTYYRQSIGRPRRLVRQYVGEIELTFAELGTFIQDVHVLVDELTPGRILRSLKSELATDYRGTTILGKYYELEDLIALYLGEIRERAEAQLGQAVQGVVLGRPVNFVGGRTEADNDRATSRLSEAALRAGFDEVAFELEPVAAALHYERSMRARQNVLVFDFGGGTLDLTVMRVGDPCTRAILATGGVGIAGDLFDQRIVQRLVLEHFGKGSTYGEDKDLFPDFYTDALTNWQTAAQLLRPEVLHLLTIAQLTGSHPARARALESLLVNDYTVRLFDKVERAKIDLSDRHFAVIQLGGHDIDLWQPLSRSQFESLIGHEVQVIAACLRDTLTQSGLRPEQIDAVVRTGGSSQIPCFVEMLGQVFGSEKVVLSDVFNSVTAGLAIRAAGL